MPLILPSLLNQVAIYWEPGGETQSGRRNYGNVTPVEVVCHWSYELKYKTNLADAKLRATSRVLTLVVVKEGGLLWLTTATINDPAGTGLAQIPAKLPYHQEIEYVEHHYSISADELLYKAYV